MGIRRGKENLSTKVTKAPGPCQVRSGTDDPCHRLASVRIGGVPFCEPCARQQEAYFSIGEFTDDPRSSRDNEQLVGLLDRMRRTKPGRRTIFTDEPEAA